MNYFNNFVYIAQKERFYNMEEKKINTGIKYKNKKYHPSVFIDRERQADIEKHFKSKGYKSFNEYVIALIDDDMKYEQE